ncbi:hypothetical protein [Rubritalea squalenifaciens]|nr:hypothetical protein [Rubritalea squalenifaciens]
MSTVHIDGMPLYPPRDNLLDKWVYFAEADGHQLQFISRDQVQEALDYFSLKIHASTMHEGIDLEHYWQYWHERLPKGMHSQRSKKIWIPTLQKLLSAIDTDKVQTRLS